MLDKYDLLLVLRNGVFFHAGGNTKSVIYKRVQALGTNISYGGPEGLYMDAVVVEAAYPVKTKGLAACIAQTASPLGRLNNLLKNIYLTFFGGHFMDTVAFIFFRT